MALAKILLRKFDPFQMPSDLVRHVAVGRNGALRELVDVVSENLETDGAPPQHLCLVAPRGTGKTFLFRLLGLELADRAAAGQKLHFLHLPEEMPHVLAPVDFLREIRNRLRRDGPAAKGPRKHENLSGWNGLVEDIDADLAARFGAGPGLLVLCVENIKDVLRDAFPDEAKQRTLRAWLERATGRVMLIAASSAGAFDRDADKALYAIVKNVHLNNWNRDETMEFLNRVVHAQSGHRLRPEDERIARAITAYTGGSPRMAVALAEVLGADDALSAAETLNALIDNLQEYYLNRLNDMGTEAKRCVANMLIEGENVSQTEVARRMGIAQPDVAQVFRKLENELYVVGDRLADHKEKFYRIADRVFVHFYNVRILYHGSERSALSPILDFLVSAFSEDQRLDQAERMVARGLHSEARVLVGTLPVVDEVTFGFKWWTGLRSFLDWTSDVIEERAADAADVVTTIREIVRDGRYVGLTPDDFMAPTNADDWSRGSDQEPPDLRSQCHGWLAPTIHDLGAAIRHDMDARPPPHVTVVSQDRPSILPEFVVSLNDLASGRFVQARRRLAKVADECGEPWLICLTHLAQAYSEYLAGDLAAQLDFACRADIVARRINDSNLLAFSLNYLRYVRAIQGHQEMAVAAIDEIISLNYPEKWKWWPSVGFRHLSRIASKSLKYEDAERYARRALEIGQSASSQSQATYSEERLAVCLLQAGHAEDALALADHAAMIYLQSGELADYQYMIEVTCDAVRQLGRPQDAINRARQAVAVQNERGGSYLRGWAFASLAWELSSPNVKVDEIPNEEVHALADRALALFGEDPVLARCRSIALQAKLAVARVANDNVQRLNLARSLAPDARRTENVEILAWALAEVIAVRSNLKQHQECIDEAIEALVELLPSSNDVSDNLRFIARNLGAALRAENRQGELKATVINIIHRASATGANKLADFARAFLGAAIEQGDYAWGVELAENLLPCHDTNEESNKTHDRMDLVLACIAGADAWRRMAHHLDEVFWTRAALQFGGWDIADVLQQTEDARGRPAAYAVFRSFWEVIRNAIDETTAQLKIMTQFITHWRVSYFSAGLLTDIADTLTAEAPGRFNAEAGMLRDFARFNASGRDPNVLAQLNPDVATALRRIDSALPAPRIAPPTAKRKSGKTKSTAKTRARK